MPSSSCSLEAQALAIIARFTASLRRDELLNAQRLGLCRAAYRPLRAQYMTTLALAALTQDVKQIEIDAPIFRYPRGLWIV